jgi:hypothetical protein
MSPSTAITAPDDTDNVGWVERGETHHLHLLRPMGFTLFNPSYGFLTIGMKARSVFGAIESPFTTLV